MQRASQHVPTAGNWRTQVPAGDNLIANIIKQGNIANAADWERLARSISTCEQGFYQLTIWQPGHMIHETAFSNEVGARRFFDPELGQYSQVGTGGPGDYIVNTLLIPTYGGAVTNWMITQFRGVPRDHVWLGNNP